MPGDPADRIGATLDHAFSGTSALRRVAAGPFELDLIGRDATLVDSLAAAFPESTEPEREADATFAVMEGDDEPMLRDFVGDHAGTRVMADDRAFAMWQDQPARCLHVYDRSSRRGFLWSAEPRMPDWARSRPLLPLIHALAAPTRWLPVHAGAVGLDGRFVLVVGPSRSGKTTATLACARAGWTFAGDDFVLVDPTTRRVEPIYVSARLRSEVVSHFGGFVDEVHVMRTELLGELREELRLTNSSNTQIGGGRFDAIVFPQRRGAKSITFEQVPASRVLSGMSWVTITELLGYRDMLMPKLLATLKSAPLFECDTGDDPAAIPNAFAGFLQRLRQ